MVFKILMPRDSLYYSRERNFCINEKKFSQIFGLKILCGWEIGLLFEDKSISLRIFGPVLNVFTKFRSSSVD